jgi:hypothetical protein
VVETCLGLFENRTFGLQAYPNPSEGILTLSCEGQPSYVEVYNVLGKQVWSGFISGQIMLNIEEWSSGTYFLYNRTVESMEPLKVVKL